MRVIHVVGARPNFMKVAPVIAAFSRYTDVRQMLVHTGQHYNQEMSDIFFQQLGLPLPDVNLEVGSGSHAQQTSQIISRLEPALLESNADWVLVYGDVNSTVAAALVCAKLLIPVAHIEAGLRSFDRTMPEEINRLLTDQISDSLFTPSRDADLNLLREGIPSEKIFCVGNVMIDTLVRLLPQADWRPILTQLALTPEQPYILATLHRPSNVDDSSILAGLVTTLAGISRDLPVIFPVHPRTRQRLIALRSATTAPNLHLVEPLSYLDFLALQRYARAVITDSGGVQEETTFLGVPCLTVRMNTERPITVDLGTNILVGQDMQVLRDEVSKILEGKAKQGRPIPLWDGQAAERIVKIITNTSV
ncbi:MAG: UDP-N-acetylglucosamine 2-epimerase (non-hydrolyzing) [Anaerolineae bacterium]|nr:UDP-N-acetylglucosamine 2-epimerase (non-hydrolyzing) [Anaerolineae bacterium]